MLETILCLSCKEIPGGVVGREGKEPFRSHMSRCSSHRNHRSRLYSLAIADNGYMDCKLMLDWIKDFDEQTKCKVRDGAYRRVFLDGFKGHLSLAVLEYAVDHKIVLVCYPPHTTHKLQGLDVAVFGRMKTLWSAKLARLQDKGVKVTKRNFLREYAEVQEQAFTPETIKAMF
jgi:hypothetical protein